MSVKYFVEGHRPKTHLEDEETLKIGGLGCETIEEATLKAKELFEKEQDMGLAVIYKESPDGTREGVKFIYKEDDGAFEDFPLYWGSCDRCFEG
jgi:hypothetical protein